MFITMGAFVRGALVLEGELLSGGRLSGHLYFHVFVLSNLRTETHYSMFNLCSIVIQFKHSFSQFFFAAFSCTILWAVKLLRQVGRRNRRRISPPIFVLCVIGFSCVDVGTLGNVRR